MEATGKSAFLGGIHLCNGHYDTPKHRLFRDHGTVFKDDYRNPTFFVPASQKNGRFMIYVHAKGMIVDDEYVILESASINQRPVAGSRDTEMAKKMYPHGQVYGFRMSLWAEHLGKIQDHFKEPKSLVCVRNINEFVEENWERFALDNFTPLPGHLLKYPIRIDTDGKVGSLPDYEHFVDVGGKIIGVVSNLPNALTT